MLSFMVFFGVACVIVFALICYVSWLSEREKTDPIFKAKIDRIRTKWDPKIVFFENLFTWILVLLMIYLIFLGGSY
ncbi:hypothetical protein SAMN05877753_10221 [Bacillus oleivorans]|uniref:Uncharacterized protein n=1 Tax=Bacillus oleivorans TaxID=1448271 RepID=A0A285CJP8_9BACI|nr:hypothetical protein SAMN05877753_10221 [Bacillus oleivorans]